MQQENVWSIPPTILREAIVNALVDSDCAHRGTPIRVVFFNDRPVIEDFSTSVRVRIFLAQRHSPFQNLATGNQNRSPTQSELEAGLVTRIVQHLQNQSAAGKAELAKALGHASVSGALHRQIRRLLDAGIIEMTIPEKPQSRLQRYRLTSAGLKLTRSDRQAS